MEPCFYYVIDKIEPYCYYDVTDKNQTIQSKYDCI